MDHGDYPAAPYGSDGRAARGAVTSYPAALGPAVTRVLEAGHANPRPVLLLHGVGARADRWAGNLRPLAENGFRPIAFDLPGHGLATKALHGHYTADEVVSDIREFLSALGVSRAAIVGTSLGGLIGAKLACQAPELCAGLMLIGSLGLEPIAAQSRLAMARSLNDTSRDGIEAKLRRVIFDPAAVTQEWIDEEWRINNSPGAPRALAEWARYVSDMTDADVTAPCLRQLGSPVTLVWGSNDEVIPVEVGQRAQQSIPASMTVIEKTGHAPYLEDPGRFNPTLITFLRSLDWTPS
jgi:2-hydroxy-6-oxonona-2,4-dienedioate hydrolase